MATFQVPNQMKSNEEWNDRHVRAKQRKVMRSNNRSSTSRQVVSWHIDSKAKKATKKATGLEYLFQFPVCSHPCPYCICLFPSTLQRFIAPHDARFGWVPPCPGVGTAWESILIYPHLDSRCSCLNETAMPLFHLKGTKPSRVAVFRPPYPG